MQPELTNTSNSLIGWHTAIIAEVTEAYARSGQAKLVMTLVIAEGPAVGHFVTGHIPVGDSPRGRSFVEGLKRSLAVPDGDTLPPPAQMVAKRVRVRLGTWIGSDGQNRESVTAFSAMLQEFSGNDTVVTITPTQDDVPF